MAELPKENADGSAFSFWVGGTGSGDKMTKYREGHKVGKGTYWNLANGSKVDMPDEGVLPGDYKTTYTSVSILALLVASPIIGFFYVIAFPFIAIAEVVVEIVGAKILRSLYDLLRDFA